MVNLLPVAPSTVMHVLMSTVLETTVHELGIMQVLYRILELFINLSTILGPTLLLVGLAFWGFSNSAAMSKLGINMAIGGVAILIFALGLLEVVIGLADWLVDI